MNDKELLLKDLSGRLPYKVICNVIIHDCHTEEGEPYNHPSYEGRGYLFCIDTLCDFVRIRPIVDNLSYREGVYFEYMANNGYISISECKPYLFPMESISGKHLYEFYCRFIQNDIPFDDFVADYWNTNSFHKLLTSIDDCERVIEWFYENHLDFRNLIPRGLAIDCTNLNIY